MTLPERNLSFLSLATVLLTATATTAQLLNPPKIPSRSVAGTAGRAAGNIGGRLDQQVTASAAYTGTGTCSTASALSYRINYLGQVGVEAAYVGVNLGASSLAFAPRASSLDVRLGGRQMFAPRFTTDGVYNGSYMASVFPRNVSMVVYVGSVAITVGGNVTVSMGHQLDLQVRNGACAVRQTGSSWADATSSVFVPGISLFTAPTTDLSFTYGATRLAVGLGATGSLGGGGSISGTATCAFDAYRLWLRACYLHFNGYSVCNTLVDYIGNASSATLLNI